MTARKAGFDVSTDYSGRIESNNYCINKISRDDFHENKLVVYLDSFDEFTEYEQKMLKSLK